MRPKIDAQGELELSTSSLKQTRQFYAKHEAISTLLDAAPEIVAAAHRDLAHALEAAARAGRREQRFR